MYTVQTIEVVKYSEVLGSLSPNASEVIYAIMNDFSWGGNSKTLAPMRLVADRLYDAALSDDPADWELEESESRELIQAQVTMTAFLKDHPFVYLDLEN